MVGGECGRLVFVRPRRSESLPTLACPNVAYALTFAAAPLGRNSELVVDAVFDSLALDQVTLTTSLAERTSLTAAPEEDA